MIINPFADPEYLIDYNLRVKDVKAGRTPKRKKGHREGEAAVSNVVVSNYNNLEFELQAPRDGSDKELYTFDKSLARLQSAGFERHPRPSEVFTLLADGLEGKLSGVQKDICNDMFKDHGEWLSLAFERKGDILLAYVDPRGLVLNEDNDKYEKKRFGYSELKKFDIHGKESNELIDLEEFSNNFVRFLYGRSFKDLPQDMKEGDKRAQLYLPSDGVVWPVARGGFDDGYYVDGCNYVIGASRGIRSTQKNFQRKRR